jgi:hypothetical protein
MNQKIFEPGDRYKVKLSFVSGTTSFVEKEVLTFERDGYSPYDSSFAYEFRDQFGTLKTWWLHEDRSIDTWKQYFGPEA